MTNKLYEIAEEIQVYKDFINDSNLRDSFKSYIEGIVDIGKYDKDFECKAEERLLEEIEEDIEMEEYQEALDNGAERSYGKLSIEKLKSLISKYRVLVSSEEDKTLRKIHKRTLRELQEEQIHRATTKKFNTENFLDSAKKSSILKGTMLAGKIDFEELAIQQHDQTMSTLSQSVNKTFNK